MGEPGESSQSLCSDKVCILSAFSSLVKRSNMIFMGLRCLILSEGDIPRKGCMGEGNEYFEIYYPLCSMQVSSTFVLAYFVKIWSIHRKCDDPNIILGETRTRRMKQHSYCLGES